MASETITGIVSIVFAVSGMFVVAYNLSLIHPALPGVFGGAMMMFSGFMLRPRKYDDGE